MKNKLLLIFSLAVVLSQTVYASSTIDVRTEYESWNSGINGKTKALLLGLGGSHRINPTWSIAGGLIIGEHDNDNLSEDSLKRSDIDFAVGYHLLPRITLYTGYRIMYINYDNSQFANRSFSDLTQGIGAGVNGIYPIYPKTFVYGRFVLSGLYSRMNPEGSDNDSGWGISSGIEFGITYQFINHTNVGFAFKQQSATIDYDNSSDEWQHNYVRYGLSLSHSF